MFEQVVLEVDLDGTYDVYSVSRFCFNGSSILMQRKPFLEANSCESIVSIVPVCFAPLETLFC